jgi:hypothetical protein
MKIDAGRGRLYDALKTIRLRWDEVAVHWNDSMRQEFEEKIWTELEQLTLDALRAMDQLGQVFQQVRQDCDENNVMRIIYS